MKLKITKSKLIKSTLKMFIDRYSLGQKHPFPTFDCSAKTSIGNWINSTKKTWFRARKWYKKSKPNRITMSDVIFENWTLFAEFLSLNQSTNIRQTVNSCDKLSCWALDVKMWNWVRFIKCSGFYTTIKSMQGRKDVRFQSSKRA